MARYLVTGGCGFIGSHLCDRLAAAGHRLLVLDDLSTGKRGNLTAAAELMIGDVADGGVLRHAMTQVDGVFHLAAIASVQKSAEDWPGTHRINLSATIGLFDLAHRLGGLPVVYASSAAVYGDAADRPLDETVRPRPISAYGADKLGCELHGRVAGLMHRLPTQGLRFFNVYGPRQDPASPYSGVISIFADRLLRRQSLTIFGDGRQSRDFVYVGDVVDHLLAAMAQCRPAADPLNVCTGDATDLLALAGIMGRLIGVTPILDHRPTREGDIRLSVGCPRLCRQRLGVSADTVLAVGLAATLGGLGRAR